MMKLLKGQTIMIVLVVAFVVALGGAAYFLNQYQKSQGEIKKLKENPRSVAQEEVKALVKKVGNLIALPQGEDPTVATITDVEKLKDQPFFAKAENGDKVLIYTQAKRAILYRPSINKIIDVAPVNIGQQGQVQPIRIALYNGTATVGLTNKNETEIEGKISNTDVVLKENASKDDYEETLVVDLSGSRKDTADQIAKLLNGKVGSLPSGEKKPESADILVILGSSLSPSPTSNQ
jgi:hypothetical protein